MHTIRPTCIIACGSFNTYSPFNTFCRVLLLYTLLYCVKGFVLCVCVCMGGLYFYTDTDSHKVNCENLAHAENLKIVNQVHGQICRLLFIVTCAHSVCFVLNRLIHSLLQLMKTKLVQWQWQYFFVIMEVT